MQTTSFTEMRRRAKKYFDAVEQGETVEVTRRGYIIARIVPADSAAKASWKKPSLRLYTRTVPKLRDNHFVLTVGRQLIFRKHLHHHNLRPIFGVII